MNELEQLKELIKKEIRLGETCDTEWDDGWDTALKMVLRWIERNKYA